jgi:hypothetical protein
VDFSYYKYNKVPGTGQQSLIALLGGVLILKGNHSERVQFKLELKKNNEANMRIFDINIDSYIAV